MGIKDKCVEMLAATLNHYGITYAAAKEREDSLLPALR
jgi:hypothetical protein